MRGDGLVGIQDDTIEVKTKSFMGLLIAQRGLFSREIRVAMDRSIVHLPSNDQASKLFPTIQEETYRPEASVGKRLV
jgi:hypothetical protein